MHKKFLIFMGAIVLLTGCSSKQSEMGLTGEGHVQETQENDGAEKGETQYLDTTASETNYFETQDETTQQDEVNEPVVINVLHQWMTAQGTYTGPRNIVLKQELNIEINFLTPDTDVDVAYENGELDIIVCSDPGWFEKYLDKGYIMSWTNEFLEEYGENLLQYEHDGIAHMAEMNDGIACGFANKYDDILSWDGYGSVYTIASNSEHQEEAMKLFNWLYDPDTYMLLNYGPQGVCWDVDEDGYFYLTDKGVQFLFETGPIDFTDQYGGVGYRSMDVMLMIDFTEIDSQNPNSAHGETYNWETWKLMKDRVEEIKSRYQ